MINVLETKKDPADTDCVVSAANNLEVSEFRIFKDAFTAWYGREATDHQIKPVFIQYLIEDKVPFWVRNYVRVILNRMDLIEKERKRWTIGALTYYIPLLIFFILIMRALL